MKKFRIVMGAMALAVAAVAIIACNKEKEAKSSQDDYEKVTVSKEDDMNAYLKQFKEKMQSAEKGDETLSLEEARWHLEAVLNYTYGDAGNQFSDIQRDTFYYKLPSKGDEITLSQLNDAFNVFSNKVENAFEECVLPEKRILAIQTDFVTESKEGGISAQIVIDMEGVTASYPCFDSTDYWSDYYYEYNGTAYGNGKCGPYSGQCPNNGAPHELTLKANLRIPEYCCQKGYRTYVTSISHVQIHPGEDSFLIDSNSPCGYKIYYNSNDPYHPTHNPSHCIPPEDMNYYLSKFMEILAHFKPDGRIPIAATYVYSVETSIPGAVLFMLDMEYAEIQCVPSPIVE